MASDDDLTWTPTSVCNVPRLEGGMETRFLWIQEELKSQRMKLTKIKGTEDATDVATKHVDAATLQKCMVTVGLINRTRYLSAVIKS